MTVAVIGCGYWGKNLVRNFAQLGALSMVVDSTEAGRETARTLAPTVPLAADVAEVWASDIPAVVIATPAETHYDIAKAALLAGKDVYVEKPLALNYDHAAELVDLAAERGGNCELTRPGEAVTEHGVTILGPLRLPSSIPFHASRMFSKNIVTFLLHLAKKGSLQIDLEDEITRETLMTRGGEILHPRLRQLLGLEMRDPITEGRPA